MPNETNAMSDFCCNKCGKRTPAIESHVMPNFARGGYDPPTCRACHFSAYPPRSIEPISTQPEASGARLFDEGCCLCGATHWEPGGRALEVLGSASFGAHQPGIQILPCVRGTWTGSDGPRTPIRSTGPPSPSNPPQPRLRAMAPCTTSRKALATSIATAARFITTVSTSRSST